MYLSEHEQIGRFSVSAEKFSKLSRFPSPEDHPIIIDGHYTVFATVYVYLLFGQVYILSVNTGFDNFLYRAHERWFNEQILNYCILIPNHF